MTPELYAGLIAALAGAIIAYLERLRRDLRENTKNTKAAENAASAAETTSNGRLTEQIKLNQSLQRENYTLRRLLDALEMDADGLRALAVARARLETLRAVRVDPAAPAHPPRLGHEDEHA